MYLLLCLQLYVVVIVLLWGVHWAFGRDTEALMLVATLMLLLRTAYDLVLAVHRATQVQL